MANNVFANGLEIACKAADGKSIAAFPDPCWSPPSPKPGWVLIPYANTAHARDTANASKTVFISGKPVMKKDRSCFKTSYGNEPAAGPKGFFTGVKKGKAYFTSWSMNVKVEGQNVDRHTNSMMHNHGSTTGNTAIWVYLDTAWHERNPCKKEFKKVEKACGGMEKQKRRRGGDVWRDVGKPVKWKKKHCGFHKFKPGDPGAMGDIKDQWDNLPDIEKVLDDALSQAVDFAVQKVRDIIVEFGVKAVVKKVILSGLGGPFGIAISVADAAMDAAKLAELNEMKDAINEELKRVQDQLGKLKDKLKNPADMKMEDVADIQDALATTDACLRARKCLLIPYSSTNSKSKNMNSLEGCCPGQTGHHVMPDSWFTLKGKRGKRDPEICPGGYSIGQAPVVCTEGTNHSHGSHGRVHDKTDENAKDAINEGGGAFDYKTARDAAIKAQQQSFPLSMCSKKCLKAQLDEYYKGKCDKGKELNPVSSKNGGDLIPGRDR